MPTERALEKDHPLMKAWAAYSGGEDYENSFKWAAHERHRKGSMWSAFVAGWRAAGGDITDNQTTREPLPLPDVDWRRRWLVTGRWTALHRIAEIEWSNDERLSGRGIAICGRKGNWQMPGILSRMSLKRCPECCKLLAIPPGEGAPFNELAGWQASV